MKLLSFVRIGIMALFLCALSGCASGGRYQQFRVEAAEASPIGELAGVPFFPQEDYQCGPAALATVLNAGGKEVTPAALAPQIYLAGRQGSLQLELKAAVRRQGLVPYEHSTASFSGLLEQLRVGQPVLVLQNLGLSWAPTWHYAVVVGFRPEQEMVLLRSGRTRLQAMSLKEFERTWHGGGYWALTVHAPDELPAGARPADYLQAVAGLEAIGELDVAATAYHAAVQHWPEQVLAWMGLGNTQYQLQRYKEAEAAYREAASLDEDNPAPWHNLAWSLIRQQKTQQALEYAQKAVQLAGVDAKAYNSALDALKRPTAQH